MADEQAPKWNFFTILVAALVLIGVAVGAFFFGRSTAQPPAPPVPTTSDLLRDTTRIYVPVTRYVERIERDTTVVWATPSYDDDALDSMQRIIDSERRTYFAADTTTVQEVVVLDMEGKPVLSRRFVDPLSLLFYPGSGYFSMQRGKKPWEIQLPMPLAHTDTWLETLWSRFKTGTAYAFIGGLTLYVVLLITGAI